MNQARAAQGKNKANSLWFWGAGTKPSLENFEKKTGKKGAMISAVDLLKGIAKGAGMAVLDVPGANGGLDTDYAGKAKAATKAVLEDGFDFVYIHVEAPDEMGHQGSIPKKVQSIERIDELVGMVKKEMDASQEAYRLLITPDHPTPIFCRTHTVTPVPWMIYDSTCQRKALGAYSEKEAQATGLYQAEGHRLMEQFLCAK